MRVNLGGPDVKKNNCDVTVASLTTSLAGILS